MRALIFSALAGLAFASAGSAQTIDRIKETSQLRLGYRVGAAPLSFADEAGMPAGYSVQVCAGVAQQIANALQIETLNVDFVTVSAEDRFDKVATGEVDLLCGAATITLSRQEKVGFSIPTYVDGAALMVPSDAPGDLGSLVGKRIGVRGSTTTETALRNSLVASGKEAEVVIFDTHEAGAAALKAGELEAYFADQSILHHLYATSGAAESLKVSSDILTIEKHGLALARGDVDFKLLVDRAVSELYATGAMERIFVDTIPSGQPGLAIKALHLIAPTLP